MRTSAQRKTTQPKARTTTRATFKPVIVPDYIEPKTDAERVARYQAAMVEWHAQQDRAKKAKAAYNKHANRNAKKTGPLAKLTKKYAEESERRFLLKDHPNDCAVCRAANAWDGESLVAAHRAVIARHAIEHLERIERIAEARKRHYENGFRIVIDGAPIRMAAHVKHWKKANRESLGQGFDRYGLTLRPHNKYGFTDDARGYWNDRCNYIDGKNFGAYDGAEKDPQHLRNAGYSVTWWNDESVLYRNQTQLFSERREVERKKQYARIPDLFTAARVDRKRLASQLAALGIRERKNLSEREAREVTRLIRSMHNATN